MTSLSSSSFVVDDDVKWFKKLVDEYPIHHNSSTVAAFTPTVSRSDYDNLKENMRALEFRISALENSYFTKLKEHEETVEMLLKVIKDAT